MPGDALVEPLARDERVLQEGGYGVRGIGHRRVAEHGERPGGRVLDEPDGRLEDQPEGALGAHQEAVETAAPLGEQVLEGVAGDLTTEATELGADGAEVLVHQAVQQVGRAVDDGAVRQQHCQRLDVVDRAAVGQGPRATRVVADHPADGAAGVRRRVRAETQASGDGLLLEHGVHDPRLHAGSAGVAVELEHPVEVAVGVHDDARTDRVAGDRRTGSAHRHRRTRLTCHRQSGRDLVGVPGAYDDQRWDPVERGVARVQRSRQLRVVDVGESSGAQRVDDVASHHSSSDRVRISAASSPVTSRGAVASRRCCFSVPSTRSSTSLLS